MSDPRTFQPLGKYPKARFRCLVCRRFVVATERGVCPRCGARPPELTGALEGREPTLWERAVGRALQPASPVELVVRALVILVAGLLLYAVLR